MWPQLQPKNTENPTQQLADVHTGQVCCRRMSAFARSKDPQLLKTAKRALPLPSTHAPDWGRDPLPDKLLVTRSQQGATMLHVPRAPRASFPTTTGGVHLSGCGVR